MTEHRKGGYKGFRFKIIVIVDGMVSKNFLLLILLLKCQYVL